MLFETAELISVLMIKLLLYYRIKCAIEFNAQRAKIKTINHRFCNYHNDMNGIWKPWTKLNHEPFTDVALML